MPRVLHLITGLHPGGAETQAARLAVELRRRGWETAVGSLLRPSGADLLVRAGPPEPALTSQNQFSAITEKPARRPCPGGAQDQEVCPTTVFSLHMHPGVPDPRALARLVFILNRFRPQILHSHMFHANVLARAARLFCPVPVVISTLHSTAEARREQSPQPCGAGAFACHGSQPGVRARDFVYRLTDPLADAVVAVSQAAADRHASSGAVRRSKLRVIPNGVDTALFHPDPERRAGIRRHLGIESQFVWLAAGRLMWKKDHATLFRAFATLAGATLLVAGEGPLEGDLRTLARELSVDARFLGRVDDMPALMNAADALVLSSVIEGLPMALLEAAASGLSAVTTDAGGAREIVADGATGFVAPCGDPAALASAMSRLEALPPEARGRMSAAARAAAEPFEIQSVVSRWDALYRELLERVSPWT